MLLEYGFPPEVQKWIIGKRIAGDDDTLSRCGIKTSGLSMFLYLISPRSGLTKTKLMHKYKHLLPAGNFVKRSVTFKLIGGKIVMLEGISFVKMRQNRGFVLIILCY